SEDGDTVDGYHIHVGGGFGPDQSLGREIYRDVKAEDAPTTVERMLKAYLAHRVSQQETFAAFTRRHEVSALKAMFEREAVASISRRARRLRNWFPTAPRSPRSSGLGSTASLPASLSLAAQASPHFRRRRTLC